MTDMPLVLRTAQFSRIVSMFCGAIGVALAGCNALTSVEAPDVVEPDDYATAAGASMLAAGAITSFNVAFGGATGTGGGFIGRNHVMQSGQIADELFATAINLSEIDWDRRTPAEPSASGGLLYAPVHNARINLLTAISSLQRTSPDSSARIGQLFALVGYTEIFLAEAFCAGVSLGSLDASFRPLYGPQLSTEQLLAQAVSHFDSALIYAADSTRLSRLAAVGKARALVNIGQFAAAATAAAGVPTSYVYSAAFVAGTINNGVYGFGTQNWVTIPEREGTNGINWRTANDPRVPLVNRSPGLRGLDGVTEVWVFVPYQASNAPIKLASGIEARLIEAEGALQQGDNAGWLSIHNSLRTTIPGLAVLVDPGTVAARVDMHFRERAFWLFLTGHRHGDLRRLVRQYGRNPETVFPTGPWRDGLAYESATNLSPSAQESNNPNYKGCLNRSA